MRGGVPVAAAVAVLAASCSASSGPLLNNPGRPDSASADPALAAWSILPPGNGNVTGFTSTWLDDQRGAYDGLDDPVADGTLTDADLGRYFKDAHLGTNTTVRTDTPAAGVAIAWDDHGVPHVHGDTSRQVAFGAGWSVAEARLLVAELGRLLGRAGTIEMAGGLSGLLDDFSKLPSLPQVNYTDAELNAAFEDALAAAGDEGPPIREAVEGFVDGMNAWIDAHPYPDTLLRLGVHPHHWNIADVLAVGTVVDDIFGSGGGGEVDNAAVLRNLGDTFGAPKARELFDQLRLRSEPDATTHVERTFPYPLFAGTPGGAATADNRADPAAVALPDPHPAMASQPPVKPSASNYVAIAGDRSASGHPILVGGPQSSYFAPELLFEMELSGGGYDSSGITFPGLGPWVVIGRSRTYAWTATAGGSDLTDQRVERLCEPDGSAPSRTSHHYLFDGACLAMTRPDTRPMTAWRTVHGPVAGTGTVNGAPVAFSRQRTSRAQAGFAAPAFWRLNQGDVTDVTRFPAVMAGVPMSFNWAYVNAHHIAYFHSGWYPVRAAGVDPDLPSWGTGEWEWRGRLAAAEQPQVVDPPQGFLVSWNNSIAPGWAAADNSWGNGAVQRVDLLGRRAAGLRDATPAAVVAAVQDAATVDLRADELLGDVWAVLGDSPAPTPALSAARDRLVAWAAAGSHRRDRNNDGFLDDLAVPLMDRFYPALVNRVFAPGLGPFVTDPRRRAPGEIDSIPSMTGSAWGKGWYSLLHRDLQKVLGSPTTAAGPAFCGGGDLDRCRDVLWQALASATFAAGNLPEATVTQQIRFLPILTNPRSMRWQNRPTYQQVMSFGG